MKSKKTRMLGKLLTLAAMILTMGMIFSFSTVSASAADTTAVVETEADTSIQIPDGMLTMEVDISSFKPQHVIMPLAGDAGGAGGGDSSSAEDSYETVIGFFITWIRRIGAVIALVGGIMFGLAIKDNNADQKQAGLMTLIAGFVVVAITAAVDMFDLFS